MSTAPSSVSPEGTVAVAGEFRVPSNSIMVRLREETAGLHRHAETRALQKAMIRGVVSRDQYAAYLGQLLLVHSAVESHLAAARAQHPAIARVHHEHQCRINDLRRDLQFFGVSADSVAPTLAAADFGEHVRMLSTSNPVALLGMLYVLEGSTNGSKYIARSIGRAFGIERGPGMSYLDPYGDRQVERWQQFRRDMDAAPLCEDDRTAIVAAAKTMFSTISCVSDQVWGT